MRESQCARLAAAVRVAELCYGFSGWLSDITPGGRLIRGESQSQCAKEMKKGLTWRSLHRRTHFSLRGTNYGTQSVQNKCI